MGKTLWNNQYRSKRQHSISSRGKREGTEQFKKHANKGKEKLKCKRKPKTHPLNRAPSGVEDKSTKPNFWYPAEVQ